MKPLQERFDEKTSKDPSGCLIWIGSIDTAGYGLFRVGRRLMKAHRFAWATSHGDPGAKQVLHKCDVRSCVLVDHLFLGSIQDNMDDRNAKGRHAHGTTHGNVILTPTQVLEIRARFGAGSSKSGLARAFGVSFGCIREIVEGRNWRHLL